MWAKRQEVGDRIKERGLDRKTVSASSMKHVLKALVEYEQSNGEAWCAISTITYDTELDRKTVIQALQDLVTLGFIEDTGRKGGDMKVSPIYRLVDFQPAEEWVRLRDKQKRAVRSPKSGTTSIEGESPKSGTTQPTESTGEKDSTGQGLSTEIGIVPNLGLVPDLAAGSPKFSATQSQIRDTNSEGTRKNSDARAPARGARSPREPEPERPRLTPEQIRAYWWPQLLSQFACGMVNELYRCHIAVSRQMQQWPERLQSMVAHSANEVVSQVVQIELNLGRRSRELDRTAEDMVKSECESLARHWRESLASAAPAPVDAVA